LVKYIEQNSFSNKIVDMDRFNERYDNLKNFCSKLNIKDINSLIIRRILDKSLMIYGGKNEEELIAIKEGFIRTEVGKYNASNTI